MVGVDATTISVRGPWAELSGPQTALEAARGALTAERQGARYTAAYERGHWDGTVCLLRRRTFPAGLTERVAEAVRAAGLDVEVSDDAKVAEGESLSGRLRGVALRPYQLEAAAVVLGRRRVALECPTGSGKTEIGAEVIRRVGRRTLWLTHRADLAKQTRARLRERLGVDVGLVGAGADDAAPLVVVGMVPTLARRLKVDASVAAALREYRVLVLDEAHHGGAETWLAVAAACVNADLRVGLSGTVRTGDPLRDLQLEGATGPRVVVASSGELSTAGFIATPTVRLLEPPTASYPSYEEVREAVLPTWRCDARPLRRMGTKLYEEAYRRGVVANAARSRAIVAAAGRHYQAGEKVLVLADLVAHARSLDRLAGEVGLARRWCLTGEDRDREAALARFRAFDPPCLLVATPWFREGMDVPEIDVGLLAGASMSEVALMQACGRMLRVRPDKRTVLIYDVLDGRDPLATKDYLADHTRARLAAYRERGWAVERPGPAR